MNQLSSVPFGSDATLLAGYAQITNAKMGNIDFLIENTGANTLYFRLKEYPVSGTVSGYGDVGPAITIVAKGQTTIRASVVSQRIGFFGSGNTTANITCVFRNPGDLRGAQIDLLASGHRGWGYDPAFNKAELTKKWGSPPDDPTTPPV
jgi:hypothetical protein